MKQLGFQTWYMLNIFVAFNLDGLGDPSLKEDMCYFCLKANPIVWVK